MNAFSDRELARLMADGDWLRRFVATLVPAQDVDDVVQATWLAALRADRAVANLRGWLLGAAANLAHLVHRGRGRRERVLRDLGAHAAARAQSRTGSDHVEALELQRLVADALLELPEPTRTVLLLRYREGLATPAIAARVGLDVATVRQRLHRGRQAVRTRFEQRFGADWRGSVAAIAGVRSAPATPLAAVCAFGLVAVAAAAALLVLAPFGSGDPVVAPASPGTVAAAGAGAGAGAGAPGDAATPPAAAPVADGVGAAPRVLAAAGQDPAPTTITLRGRLVAAEDGTAIAGVLHHAGTKLSTGDDGRFVIDIATAQREQVVMMHAEERCGRYCEPGTESRDLGDVAMRRGTRIRGLVLDEAGAPVPRLAVGGWYLEEVAGGPRLSATERTAENGTFTFRHCVPFGPFRIESKGTAWSLLDDTVDVQPPPAANHFVLRVARRPAITGICVTADGRPCRDLEIEAAVSVAGRPPSRTVGSARTADDGSFELFQRESADGAISLRTPIFGTHGLVGTPGTVRWGEAGVRLELAPRVPVRLRVVEAPSRAPVEHFEVLASWVEADTVTSTAFAGTREPHAGGIVTSEGVAPGMQLGIWPQDPALAPVRLVVEESMRGQREIVVELVRLRPMALTLVDARGAPLTSECWLLDPSGARPGGFVDDRRGAVRLHASGVTALRLSRTTTDARGMGTLLATEPTATRPLVLAVPRGPHGTPPLWLPFRPAADGTVRAVVPD